METEVHISRHLDLPLQFFADRSDAGKALTRWIDPPADEGALVFALPRGGVPVGRPLADRLGCALLPALVRKLPIPRNPEMGFGAVAVDGTVRLNGPVVEAYGIPAPVVKEIAAKVRREVERRSMVYRGGWPLPDLTGRNLWLVDDGLATGLTMLTAAGMLSAAAPASVSIAVPCASRGPLASLAGAADAVWCLALQESGSFAVASFYRDFHDLADGEVLEALDR